MRVGLRTLLIDGYLTDSWVGNSRCREAVPPIWISSVPPVREADGLRKHRRLIFVEPQRVGEELMIDPAAAVRGQHPVRAQHVERVESFALAVLDQRNGQGFGCAERKKGIDSTRSPKHRTVATTFYQWCKIVKSSASALSQVYGRGFQWNNHTTQRHG